MSAKEKDIKVVDLTKDADSKTPKKQTQMRLPFAKIDKNAALAKMETEVKKMSEEAKKRKLSVSSDDDKDGVRNEVSKSELATTPSTKGAIKVKIGGAKKKAKTEDSNEIQVVENSPAISAVKPVKQSTTPLKSETDVKVINSSSTPTTKDSPKPKSDAKSKKVTPSPSTKAKSEKEAPRLEEVESEKNAKLEVSTPSVPPMIKDAIPMTPENKGKRKASDSTPETNGTSEKIKKMTPKQLARKAELDKKREEKEKLKEEAKLAKEAEKAKEKERKEAEKEKERLQKEQEKLEKERLRQEAKLAKEAEKAKEKDEKMKKKQEAEQQKENERLEKERAKQEKIEAKEKKEREEKAKADKLKQSFASFFVKKDTPKKSEEETKETVSSNGLNQFRVKDNMKLAPTVRSSQFSNESKVELDSKLNSGTMKDHLYVSLLRQGNVKAQSMGKTWPYSCKKVDDDDVEIIEEEDDMLGDEIQDDQEINKQVKTKSVFRKAKLLQFCENQRPPYFGTWSKKTLKVGPRKPFAMDSEIFDYDYDSDDDWEEEEQGESLSDEEKDKEEDENDAAKEDDDDDDGFFVGHGVLDKDELKAAEEFDEDAFDEELEIKKQKLKAQQFEEEYKKKKPNKLKPRVFGCFWNDPKNYSKDEIAFDQLIKILTPFKAVSLTLTSMIPTTLSHPKNDESKENSPKNEKAANDSINKPKPLKEVPEEAMPDLIRLVHANTNNKIFLAKEFVHFWNTKNELQPLPKSKALQKLQDIADYQKSEALSRKCWLVKNDVLVKYGIAEPDIPNKWDYILEQPNKAANTPTTPVGTTPAKAANEKSSSTETPKSEKVSDKSGNVRERPPPASLITKFTKVLSEEERLKALKDAADKAKTDKEEAAANKEKEKLVQNAKPSSTAAQGTPKRIQPTLIDLTKN